MKKAECKKCRREGKKLFLKGSRCLGAKCALTRRTYAPGARGQARYSKVSDYGRQLREKQRAKRIYNLRERQFRNYFKKASKHRQATGEVLLQLLERRLDNVCYLLGFAPSRKAARQLVTHGHLRINGKKVNIPSFMVKPKDKIEVFPKDKIKFAKTEIPVWLSFDKKNSSAEMIKIPQRQEMPEEIEETLIVEFYSR